MSRVIILPRFTVIFTGFGVVRRQFATTDASAARASTNELARWTTRHFTQRRYNYTYKLYASFKLLTGRGYTGPTTLSVQSVARGLPSGS